MPKVNEEIEEDYLEVDKPIPGQSFCCLSFVSPEKILVEKDKFLFYHYQRFRLDRYNKMLNSAFSTMIEDNEDGTVELSKLFDMRKTMDSLFKEDEIEFNDFKEKFDDFRFRDEKKIFDEFDKQNNFRTSVRGLKVRGVYNTRQEAEMRAKILQRNDQSFNIFVGQVGYWLPWDPESNDIEDQEYLNEELNKLVKEKKNNDAKKDLFYQEQKAERIKDATSAAERLRKKYDEKKKLEAEANKTESVTEETSETPLPEIPSTSASNNLETTETPVIPPSEELDGSKLNQLNDDLEVQLNESDQQLNETISQLNEVDPWMARKEQSN